MIVSNNIIVTFYAASATNLGWFTLTGAIRCRREGDVDIPGGVHHSTGLHQLPALLRHQPAIPTSGMVYVVRPHRVNYLFLVQLSYKN